MQNNNDNLQYNSCIYKGICSINPRTSALQNVLGLYLNLCGKYSLKLHEKQSLSPRIRNFILNTVAISVSNPEFTETGFLEAISELKRILPELIETYNNLYNKEDFKGENIISSDVFKKCENIIDAIKFGEYINRTMLAKIPSQTRDLLKTMLVISKSICLNLLDLESYQNLTNDCNDAFTTLLIILNSLKEENPETIKKLIYEGSKCNTKLMKLLHDEQEKRYGKQEIVNISYTTTPSKAVLAVGSNIRELETLLEALKNTNIDVYTHDEMMVAHTFPFFNKYQNLKGQYGHGLENCLIDFATFPGPIILTKHSLHNIENFYRGRLFTTDINFHKGIIQIENDDYTEVIKSANASKGFKHGKVCETVTVGYNYENCIKLIEDSLSSNNYKKIVLIGLKNYSTQQREYFESLIKHISNAILIISFSYNFERKNLLYFNTCFDSYAIVRIASALRNYKLPLDIFLPKCGRNTLTEMIHFAKIQTNTVYMGECEPIVINPSMKNTLNKFFNIKTIATAKKDLNSINKL